MRFVRLATTASGSSKGISASRKSSSASSHARVSLSTPCRAPGTRSKTRKSRPQFPIPHRGLTPGAVGSCIGPIHLKCLANKARDAVTNIGESSAFRLQREHGSLLQETIHQHQQDLPFRRKVLIEAPHSDACMMSNVLNRGLLIAPLSKKRQCRLQQRLSFPPAPLLPWRRRKVLPG